jgi:hypothetical protein
MGPSREMIFVALAIVVLLVIWQFLGSLWSSAEAQRPRGALRSSEMIVPMERAGRRKRLGRCDEE